MRGGLLVGCYDGGALIRIRISTLQFPIGEANIYEALWQNEKAYERREAKFYERFPRSRCAICGKYYIVKAKGWACSRVCAEMLAEISKEH